jgi:hypothetical protein
VGEHTKGWKKMNMVEILSTHVWKWKNETWWNYSKWRMGDEVNEGGLNLAKIHCKYSCKCHNVPLVQQW